MAEAEEMKRPTRMDEPKKSFCRPFRKPEGYFHAGSNAATIAQMADNAYRIVKSYTPNVATLQAGTNDFFFSPPRGTDASGALERLKTWVDNAFRAAVDANISPFHVAISATTTINATKCATYETAPWNPPNCPADMPENIDTFATLIHAYVEQYNAAKGYTALSFLA